MFSPARSETRTTCPYCGVGCGVIVTTEAQNIIDVRGDPDHPANFGRLCSKGSTLHLTTGDAVAAAARALHPELRIGKADVRSRVSWDTALDHAAARFADVIAQHGPDAVAFYVSGQFLTEDYYVFNKLAKGLIGTNNIDSNSRLCMSSAVAGYKRTLGADAPPACYEDVDHADCVFITGSNAAWAHPVLFRRLEDARARNRAQRLIVADPRRTETARCAGLHLQLLPGTDVALHHGLLHVAIAEGWIAHDFIHAHTEGFDALRALVRDFTPAHTAQITGLAVDDIVQAAQWISNAKAWLSLYCQGLNQSSSGTAKNESLINLHLALGQIGKPGAGPFSLTGQPNAMGGRETGSMANLMSGHRELANPAHRAELAALWGVADVPARPGHTAVELFEAAAAGTIKALWIACTNPAQSLPDQTLVKRALERCEFVIVQEAWRDTATAAFADLLLPAASWGEKEGTVTNSERCISRVRAARAAPGEAREDWRIGVQFAHRLASMVRPAASSAFAFDTPESIWNEHRTTTRGRDLDVTGLSYAILERDGPQQWPCPAGATGATGATDATGATNATPAAATHPRKHGLARLYADGVFPTANGRARFSATPHMPVAEPPDARYPLALNTGRLRDHWHGMSRTARAARLFGHTPGPAVELNPRDAARRGLAAGDLVELTTRHGQLVLPWQADEGLRSGQAYIPMHWGSEFVRGGVNLLTSKALDPVSRQPELKHAALAVERASLPWQAWFAGWFGEGQAQTARAHLLHAARDFDFALCVPFGRERTGLLCRLAAHNAPSPAQIEPFFAAFGLDGTEVLAYHDPVRRQARRLRTDGTRLQAFGLAGSVTGSDWLLDWLKNETALQMPLGALLRPSATAPAGGEVAGRVICNCLNINERSLERAAAQCPAQTPLLTHWETTLKCGTQCGSCKPELKRMAAELREPASAQM